MQGYFSANNFSLQKYIYILIPLFQRASFFEKIASSSNIPAASEEKAESLEGREGRKGSFFLLGDSSRFKELYGGSGGAPF